MAERDSLLPEFPTHPLGNFHLDPNPFFGAVGYGYLGGVDQPVTVERFHYADKFWNGWPSSTQPIWRAPPFTIFPHWNAQGQADLGVVRDGGRQFCSGGRCTAALTWPALKSPFDPGANLRFGWMGSLLEDKRDADGTLYRRHRYLDPQSGRFTQPDPIGIAGGLNLYGYANGDPVNYSDPFGLCPQVPQLCIAIAIAAGKAIGSAAGTPTGQRIIHRGSDLARSLMASGVVRNAGEAAHHIVARGAARAAPARAALSEFRIGVDEAANGVFLPAVRGYVGAAANHLTLHTERYYRSVNDFILQASKREEAIEALAAIRDQLLRGTFPR